MADITKCSSIDCPLRKTCYRATVKDSEWQSYAMFEPILSAIGADCLHYIQNDPKTRTKRRTK